MHAVPLLFVAALLTFPLSVPLSQYLFGHFHVVIARTMPGQALLSLLGTLLGGTLLLNDTTLGQVLLSLLGTLLGGRL